MDFFAAREGAPCVLLLLVSLALMPASLGQSNMSCEMGPRKIRIGAIQGEKSGCPRRGWLPCWLQRPCSLRRTQKMQLNIQRRRFSEFLAIEFAVFADRGDGAG